MAGQDVIQRVMQFTGQSLTETLTAIEAKLRGRNGGGVRAVNSAVKVDRTLLADAAAIKRASAQIDVTIQAAGMLYALPYLLEESETVTRVRLGAGDVAADFHLVTNLRIAQFKFVQWQDKGNGAREVSLFEDFFKLAAEQTSKRKYLYLLDTVMPLRFLQSGRDIDKVLKQNRPMQDEFTKRYGHTYRTVGMYYAAHRQTIQIVDLTRLVPGLDELVRDLPAGDQPAADRPGAE